MLSAFILSAAGSGAMQPRPGEAGTGAPQYRDGLTVFFAPSGRLQRSLRHAIVAPAWVLIAYLSTLKQNSGKFRSILSGLIS